MVVCWMASHVYLQYHPMQSCPAIDPSAGVFALPFKTPAHRKVEKKYEELVNKCEQADNILREKNERLVKENTDLRSERDNDARERGELRRQNERLVKENTDLRSERDNDARERGELRIQNEKLQSNVETLQEDHAKVMSESREKDKKIDLYQKQIEHFKHTASEARETYNQLKTMALLAHNDERESNKKVNELTEALKLKDKQHDSDNKKLKSRESAHEFLLRQMRVMESKIEDYESRNNRLKEILKDNNRLKEIIDKNNGLKDTFKDNNHPREIIEKNNRLT